MEGFGSEEPKCQIRYRDAAEDEDEREDLRSQSGSFH